MDWMTGVRFPEGAEILSPHYLIQTGSGPTQPPM